MSMPSDEQTGDQHEGSSPEGLPTRSEMALMRRAVRERWGIPDAMKSDMLVMVLAVLDSPSASTRDKLAAGRLLATIDRIDQADLRAAAAGPDTRTVDPEVAARVLQALIPDDGLGDLPQHPAG